MKAGKVVTDMTVAEQAVANNYITEELRKSVDEELAALEEQQIEDVEDVEEISEVKETSPLLNTFLNKTVYYKGEPYVVEMEGEKFILNSETKIIELEADQNSTIADVDVIVPQAPQKIDKYTVELIDENSVIVNNVTYTINTDSTGNTISLSPTNKPEQALENEAMMVAVDIERSKQEYNELEEIVDDITDEHLEKILSFEDRVALTALENAYQNMNSTVEAALAKLYNPKTVGTLTEQEMLQVDLFVNDAYWRISELNEKNPNVIFTNALNTLEIVNNILYNQNPEFYEIQRSKATSTNESTKTRQKRTSKRSPKKSAKEEVTEERKEITLLDVETMAQKVSSPERLDELKTYLSEQFLIGNIADDVYNISDRIIEERLIQIEKGISLELNLDTLTEGQQLMVKNDIFTGSNTKLVSVNDTVIVKSTANGKLTVALYGRPNVTKVVSEADINKYFTTMDLEKAKAKAADQPLTKEDKEVIKENDDMLDSFLKDGDRLDTLRKEASNQSLKDIEDTLLDELDC